MMPPSIKAVAISPQAPQLPPKPGIVGVDLDKTILRGDSQWSLVRYGFMTEGLDVALRKFGGPRINEEDPLSLKLRKFVVDKRDLLLSVLTLVRRYNAGTLYPGEAGEAVAAVLEGLPVLDSARKWAQAPATHLEIRRDILDFAHEKAKAIVRAEIDEGRLKEEDLEEEARNRFRIWTSQFTEVVRIFVEEHQDVFRVNPENIKGSTGTFVGAEGVFSNEGDDFYYNFGPAKPMGEEFDPKTSIMISDSINDRPMWDSVVPANRIVVNPQRSRKLRRYVKSEKTSYILSTEFETRIGERTPDGRFKYETSPGFFYESQDPFTRSATMTRAFIWSLEMTPLSLMAVARGESIEAIIPLAAGLVYGPLNRSTTAHVVAGAMISGGMASFIRGEFVPSYYALWATVIGGVTFAAANALMEIQHRSVSNQIGKAGFSTFNRFMNSVSRSGIKTLWGAFLTPTIRWGLKLFGLG